jgi:hypothetical protein
VFVLFGLTPIIAATLIWLLPRSVALIAAKV